MSALAINNLNTVADMNAILGGAVLIRSTYKGSHIINGSWSYVGTFYRTKRRWGRFRLVDKKRVYKRTQYKHYHWDNLYFG